MKYRELMEILASHPKERLEDDVTIYIPGQDEFLPVLFICEADDNSVLDEGHLYLETIE